MVQKGKFLQIPYQLPTKTQVVWQLRY